MSWVEKRVEAYNKGEKPTWLEKRALEHAQPVHFVLVIAATVALVYGLWMHDWTWIIVGVILGFLGHVYCWVIK